MWSNAKRIILAVFGAGIVALIVINAIVTKPDKSYDVWSSAMTMGNSSAEHHFIVYTDIFCPYCDNYSRTLENHMDEFRRDYLDNNKVFYEIRLTDMIADHSVNSERGGEAGYCAADQGRFWGFYDAILAQLKVDWHDKGIGVSKTSPEIPKLDDDYYYKAAETAGDLDAGQFRDCMNNHKTLDLLNKNTARAARIVTSGLPYFVFDQWSGSGFDGDWRTIQAMFQAGGAK